MKYQLPLLSYDYNALEPYISQEMLKIHHDKHHKAYVDGLNNAVERLNDMRTSGDYSLIKHWERELAFNGSGHILHSMYWNNLAPAGTKMDIAGTLMSQIQIDFGSFDTLKSQFSAASVAVEASGWAVLGWSPLLKKLFILQSEKHQNLTLWGIEPLLILDVWEHAYYIQYQNKRADYVNGFWNIVNFEEVSSRFENAICKTF